MRRYVLSDLHLGEDADDWLRLLAIEEFLRRAIRDRAQIISVGDYFDLADGVSYQMLQRATERLRRVLLDYEEAVGLPIEVVRGNHDRYLTAELIAEFLPGVKHRIQRNFFFDSVAGICVHHGDLADTKDVDLRAYLAQYQGATVEDLRHFLAAGCPEFYDDRHGYHARNMFDLTTLTRILEKAHIPRDVQLAIYDLWYEDSVRTEIRKSIKEGVVTAKAPAEFVFNTWLMKQLPVWAVVQGHTHLPYQLSWKDSGTGRAAVIANVGSMAKGVRVPSGGILDPEIKRSSLLAYRHKGWEVESCVTPQDQSELHLVRR